MVQGPSLHRPSPHIPLANITLIQQVSPQSSYPILDSTDYEELAMVLYHQVSDQDTRIMAMEADKEN